MNQILLNVLAQDPSKTPGICLSFRWLLPFIPSFENMICWFFLPLACKWMGCIFIDSDDLWNQVFSVSGLLYISTFISILPKPHTSSKLWFDANLFTVLCYSIYFVELGVIAYYNMDLEYSISWLFDVVFSTALTMIFYGILLGLRMTTSAYVKTICKICIFINIGSLITLGMITPFTSKNIFILLSLIFIIYLLLTDRHPALSAGRSTAPNLSENNTMIIRCLFWGAMSVWVDYLAITSFYILETLLTTESHKREDSVLYYCKTQWESQKSKILGNIKEAIQSLQGRMTFCMVSHHNLNKLYLSGKQFH